MNRMGRLLDEDDVIGALMEQFKRNTPIAIRAKLTVEALPPAQPEPKWIPVTKRLPKIGKEVLLSEPNAMFIAEYHGSGNAEGLWVVDACHHYLADVNKCAWMPLQKSYMRGVQDE